MVNDNPVMSSPFFDLFDHYTQIWETGAPPEGAFYKVVEEEWVTNISRPVRLIKKWELSTS